jgi:hypothetical protein
MHIGLSLLLDLEYEYCNKLLKSIPYRVVIAELLREGWAKASNYGGTWSELQDRITKLYGAALQCTSPQLVQLVQVITKFSVSCWHSSFIEVLNYELLGLFNLFPAFPFLVENLHLMQKTMLFSLLLWKFDSTFSYDTHRNFSP